LTEIVGNALPARSRWGLVHNDFCATNLSVGEDGGLFSIDNEHMARGFLEYDLGRVWYRWPMSESDERRFLRRYRSAQGAGPPPEEQRGWRAIATLKGAHLRHRIGANNDDALSALRRLLD
jgi:thiamine kinase-like enzyme